MHVHWQSACNIHRVHVTFTVSHVYQFYHFDKNNTKVKTPEKNMFKYHFQPPPNQNVNTSPGRGLSILLPYPRIPFKVRRLIWKPFMGCHVCVTSMRTIHPVALFPCSSRLRCLLEFHGCQTENYNLEHACSIVVIRFRKGTGTLDI